MLPHSSELTPSAQPSRQARRAAGKELRQKVPRSHHSHWQPPVDRPDPIALIEQSNQQRIDHLIPIRHYRMMQSPFTLLRGSAVIMAADLATTPTTGIRVQACGDCHLLNFGGFATPERNLIFDVNDFDETLVAPWEWDLKRLVTSIAVAGHDLSLPKQATSDAVLAAAQAYRMAITQYSQMRTLEVWYARLDASLLIEHAPDEDTRQQWTQMAARAFSRTSDRAVAQLTERVDGQYRLIDNPPLLYHPPNQPEYFESIQAVFEQYRDTLQVDRQFLLDRYRLVDAALKVVGVGSVGTHCGVVLLLDDNEDPLLLQYKEARPSVLEPYVGTSPYSHEGERIVSGQRLMQAASDIFLGWTSNQQGQDFYFRQLKDMKTSIKVKGMSARRLEDYAEICGAALARAHARTGDAAMISGYLGQSNKFDLAITAFAMTYAQQVEQDYHALVTAIQSGRLAAEPG
ncbi:MAG: DUF2252 domain-containing protein [Synechococcales cyanobacterium C42_A2020_086]|nr:DUF2252 domain-containing protein [Synechococcales cyanobacterium C42_A2020_086]